MAGEPTVSTAGGESKMVLSTAASTPAGTCSVTVTGTGAKVTRTTSFTLTVGTGGGGACAGYETVHSGFARGNTPFSPMRHHLVCFGEGS